MAEPASVTAGPEDAQVVGNAALIKSLLTFEMLRRLPAICGSLRF
jgi:hypothetical protein